ncbi:hypothetical protein BC827DRAFT_60149 [Russula dissimulans]|nr:hypothetical protein BC827DRAFT_60149 [Russula dissimulans]
MRREIQRDPVSDPLACKNSPCVTGSTSTRPLTLIPCLPLRVSFVDMCSPTPSTPHSSTTALPRLSGKVTIHEGRGLGAARRGDRGDDGKQSWRTPLSVSDANNEHTSELIMYIHSIGTRTHLYPPDFLSTWYQLQELTSRASVVAVLMPILRREAMF